jgi:hypothetical protein
MVVVGAPKVVGDAMFIHLKVTTRSTFSVEEDNKTRTNDMSLDSFIKKKVTCRLIKP